ncbi:MAG: DUF1778 domain-containing protein [Planctomycetia bacterium]|nr:DUF1778 domain-containing protein [Planctomycetia bacterium]
MAVRVASTPKTKTKKISATLPAHVHERLEEAAAWRGVALSEFLVDAAVREAEQVIERERIIRLSQEDAKLIFSLMKNPPPPNAAMKKAMQTHKRLTRDS